MTDYGKIIINVAISEKNQEDEVAEQSRIVYLIQNSGFAIFSVELYQFKPIITHSTVNFKEEKFWIIDANKKQSSFNRIINRFKKALKLS